MIRRCIQSLLNSDQNDTWVLTESKTRQSAILAEQHLAMAGAFGKRLNFCVIFLILYTALFRIFCV